MKLSFVETHSPVFHGGKNFHTKITADAETKLNLIVREIDGHPFLFLELNYRGKPHLLPVNSVNGVTEEVGMIKAPQNVTHPMTAAAMATAQVSTPHDAVFAGPNKPVVTRRRIAKVQGE